MEINRSTSAANIKLIAQFPTKMRQALEAAGVRLEDVASMSFEELIKIPGVNRGLLSDYAKRSDRIREWQRSPVNPNGFLELDDGRRVLYRDIRRARSSPRAMSVFGFVYSGNIATSEAKAAIREFSKTVSDYDIALYLADLRDAIAKGEADDEIFDYSARTYVGVAPPPSQTVDQELSALVKEIMDALEREYDLSNAPINDREQVKHLANLMARRVFLDRRAFSLEVTIASPDRDEDEKNAARREYEWVQKQIGALNALITPIQDKLQITPQARASLQGTTQAWQVLSDLVRESKKVRARLVSHHPTYIDDNAVLMGYTLWYHPHPDHAPYCRACGSKEIVYRGLSGEEHALRLWTDEAARLYIRAKDFHPSGAPLGIGVFDDQA